MKKDEFIEKYGEERYEKFKEQIGEWQKKHPTRVKEKNRAHKHKSKKGGKYYENRKRYNSTGLRGERVRIRCSHCYRYREHKQIIAPESQLHHQWVPNTSDYTAIALVEKDQHLHGVIDVILIIEGEITLLTEAEIRERR